MNKIKIVTKVNVNITDKYKKSNGGNKGGYQKNSYNSRQVAPSTDGDLPF